MDKPPIEAVLEHYGADLVPSRHGWASMLCPFHDDTTRSGSVNTEEGYFKCFTCDVSGDAFDLIQLKEGLEFRESVEFATRVFGASDSRVRAVPPRGRFVPGRQRDQRKRRPYIPPRRSS